MKKRPLPMDKEFPLHSCVIGPLSDSKGHIPLPTAFLSHKLCVIVPFRDRDEELSEFAPHISKFLRKQGIDFYLLLMNQTDNFRFNRASLINVGWLESDRVGCDYMVMHDVDLLPLNSEISYRFPGEGVVRHISSPSYHPKYSYSKFIGGILMLTMNDYKAVNGMSNKYWGWGLEDDEFYLRIKDAGLNLTRVENLSSNRSNTFLHLHGAKRKRDYAVVTKDQKAMKRKRDYISGLNNVGYNITSRRIRYFGEAAVHVVDVQLFCDMKWTPYCKLPSRY
ncbi:Xylosylprotein 4-beta-galactosyltransferase [Parelaphostrongylus tenuis]|uniref:Xylosylprotein 4-beta-galactosyltransferase n=1 Tax=Parelaphostrongylus tenuis TaxID=148309 RepID=A0AAD5MG69_PARTN|nr:Xylosylprotein 4-beta-galactosyltransferase [Parelaphostrongylus tenuis]